MTYPTGQPDQKHDLVCPQTLPREGSLLDSPLGFSRTVDIFQALGRPHPPLKQTAVVLTYKDAPQDHKLSKALIIIGFAGSSLKVVRQLIADDNIPNCIQKCTLAVQRGDGDYASRLERYHVTNSPKFAKFMKRMQRENIVAILAPDKYGRFGILIPSTETNPGEGAYIKEDFCATLFVGEVDAVKRYLAGGAGESRQTMQDDESQPTFVPTTPPMDESNDGPIWKPPEEENDANDGPIWKPPEEENDTNDGPIWEPPNNEEDTNDAPIWKPPGEDETNDAPIWKPPGGDDNDNDESMWKPPGNDDNNDSSSGLWQPPGNSNDNGGFGNNDSGGSDLWKPPSATEDNSGGFDDPWGESENGNNKRSHDEMESGNNFHADAGAAAADAFYSGLTRSLDTRSASRIFHMRAFNGWVKATQIQELNPYIVGSKSRRLRVLDLACGKGGDLGKWVHHSRGIQNYVGVDVARGSLKDAAIRARKMRNKLGKCCTFTCADLGYDVPGRYRSHRNSKMQKLLSWSLQNEPENEADDPIFSNVRGGGISLDDKFDVISIQFAIHYMMQTRKRARRFFQTCSELLELGGNLICTTIDARVVVEKLMDQGLNLHFDENDDAEIPDSAVVTVGNGACNIKFTGEMVQRLFDSLSNTQNQKNDAEESFGIEYTFTLVEGSDHDAGVGDAVNLPEWLNPIPMLEAVANDAGLELVSAENFHEFYNNRRDPSAFPAAHEALYNMKVLNRNGSIYPDNWEISGMYCAIKFKKVRESRLNLEDDEGGEFVEEEDDEEEPPKEVPKVKPSNVAVTNSKMLPMAMMKAKKNVGADQWKLLSGEEKKALIQTELENLSNPV